jgi:hypothetical protein
MPPSTLWLDVAYRLGHLPAVAPRVLEHARALAVLVGRQFLEDARAGITDTGERRIDVWHAHLDDVGGDAGVGAT